MLWYFLNRMAGIAFGGGESYQLELARALRDQGEAVKFFAGRKIFGPALKIPDFPATYIRSPFLRGLVHMRWGGYRALLMDTWLFSRAVYTEIAKFPPPDVILVNDVLLQADQLRRIFPGAVLAAFMPGPCLPAWLENLKRYDLVVSEGYYYQELQKEFPEGARTIACGVDTARFRPRQENLRARWNLSGEHVVILHVGRHIPIKNLPLLIRSFARALEERPNLRLVAVGTGTHHREAVALAEKLDLEGRIFFEGSVSAENLPLYYNSADIFALTSKFENYPLTLLEAMASGLPIVATRVGGIPMRIADGKNGFLAGSDDVAGLAAAILKLAGDQALRQQMGQYNVDQVKKENSWKVAAEGYKALVLSLKKSNSVNTLLKV